MAVVHTDLRNYLPLVASGKVREIYDLTDGNLLFVTTDRISAYDVVMENGIDEKGSILTNLSEFWFTLLSNMMPELRTHYVSLQLPAELQKRLPSDLLSQLLNRSMVVQRLKVLPIESIVRGYITGSAWTSYQRNGKVCEIRMPPDLRESQKLERPLWTPSTKAEVGGTDENISPEKAATVIGREIAEQVEQLSIQIYEKANDYAAQRGIILADTKFEFGLDESVEPPRVVLIDEVLTPDSSRFWPQDTYEIGRGQASFDKQYLRDWLTRSGLKGKSGVEMPEEVVVNTLKRYKDAYSQLVGHEWKGMQGTQRAGNASSSLAE